MKITLPYWSLFLLGLIATICIAPAADAQETDDIAYGSDPLQKLDICLPDTGTDRTVLLLIHGGAWHLGDKRGDGGLCQLAAKQGIIGVRVGYRLAAGTPGTIWPAQINDVEAALQWVRAHSTDIKANPNRICAYGTSAGGHLTVFLAVHHEVACAIDAFGPVDLTGYPMEHGGDLGRLLFGSDVDNPDAIERDKRNASPLFLVDGNTPPMLIIQGTRDTTVPPSQSAALIDELHRAGKSPQLINYDGEHAYRGITHDQLLEIFGKILEFVASTTNGKR
jgi:acetyl esterase/lipase